MCPKREVDAGRAAMRAHVPETQARWVGVPALFTVTLNDDGLVHANCFEVMEQVNNREACGIFEQNVWL